MITRCVDALDATKSILQTSNQSICATSNELEIFTVDTPIPTTFKLSFHIGYNNRLSHTLIHYIPCHVDLIRVDLLHQFFVKQ